MLHLLFVHFLGCTEACCNFNIKQIVRIAVFEEYNFKLSVTSLQSRKHKYMDGYEFLPHWETSVFNYKVFRVSECQENSNADSSLFMTTIGAKISLANQNGC